MQVSSFVFFYMELEEIMENLSVLKFGGSSVATIEKIKEISDYLGKRVKHGEKLIVVVSAMGKTTDFLLKQVGQITTNPDTRELDTLLAVGEQNTISLMAIALNNIGTKSRDRKSTRLNSSHANISYAVFCLKKKKHVFTFPLRIF